MSIWYLSCTCTFEQGRRQKLLAMLLFKGKRDKAPMKLTAKLIGLALAALFFLALPAKADGIVVNYELTGQGFDFKFTLPETFTPDANAFGTIVENNVNASLNGTPAVLTVSMGTTFLGFPNLVSYGNSPPELSLYAPGLFTWDGNSVVLNPGTFNLGSYPAYLQGKYDYTLTATAVNTPEPSSLILLGMGSLSLLGLKFRRRTA